MPFPPSNPDGNNSTAIYLKRHRTAIPEVLLRRAAPPSAQPHTRVLASRE